MQENFVDFRSSLFQLSVFQVRCSSGVEVLAVEAATDPEGEHLLEGVLPSVHLRICFA